jgi:putative FmdB family regulatory protein
MPLFKFQCMDCENMVEILVRGSQEPTCDACGSTRLEKQMSRFAPVMGGASQPEPMACGTSGCPRFEAGACGHG